MGIFSEALAKFAPVDTAPSPDTIPNSLRRGWDSGMLGAGSQLQSVAGLVGEAVGADEFAKNRNADAMSLRGQAEQVAPQVGRWDQVHGLRDFGNYAAGLVGGSAPISLAGMGAAALTGGGVVPGILAAGAVTAPFEMGDVIQKQQADPEAMNKTAGERLSAAALGGGASALAQGLVPGIVGKQLKGLGATRAAGQSLRGVLAQNVVGDALLEGGAEGGGDIIKQYAANQDRDLDWDSVKENTIGGAVAGGAMGGLGATGDLVHRNGPMLKDGFKSIKDRLAARAEAAKTLGEEKLATAGETAPGKKVMSAFDDLSDLVQRGKDAVSDAVGKVMRGEEMGIDVKEMATASGDRLKEMMDFSDNEKVKAVKQWTGDMLAKMKLDDPRRAEIEEAAKNAGDRAAQVVIAKTKSAFDVGQQAAGKVQDFLRSLSGEKDQNAQIKDMIDKSEASAMAAFNLGPDGNPAGAKSSISERLAKAVKDNMPESKAPLADITPEQRDAFLAEKQAAGMTRREAMKALEASRETKKSEDYSGTEMAILESLQKNGLAQRRPELFSEPGTINELATGLRKVLNQMSEGPLEPKVVKHLTEILGDDTTSVINGLKRVLRDDRNEDYIKNLNKLTEVQKRTDELNSSLKALLIPAHQNMSDYELMQLGDALSAHARGEHMYGADAKGMDAKAVTAHDIAVNNQAREVYTRYFGNNEDAASKLIQDHALPKQRVEERAASSALDENGNMKEGDKATFDERGERQSPEDLETMRFGLTEPDAKGNSKSKLNGEPMAKDNRYTKQHIEDLKVKYPKHDVSWEKAEGSELGHIKVEKQADPEALTTADVESMRLSKKYPNSPDKITVGGVALDTKRIAKVMDRRLEYSAADEQSRAHRMARMFNEGLARLMELHGKFDVPDKAVIGEVGGKSLTFGMAKKLRSDTARPEHKRLAELREEYKKAITPQERSEIKAEAEAIRDAGKIAEPDGARTDDPEMAKYESGKGTEIHAAAAEVKPDDLVVRSNMDGSGHSHNASDRVSELEGTARAELLSTTYKWANVKGAGVKALADRTRTLLTNASMLGAKDKRQLLELAGKSPAEAAPVVNALARKYKDRILPPEGREQAGVGRAGEFGNKKQLKGQSPAETAHDYRQGELNTAFTTQEVSGKRSIDGGRQPDKRDFPGKDAVRSTPDPKALAAKKAASFGDAEDVASLADGRDHTKFSVMSELQRGHIGGALRGLYGVLHDRVMNAVKFVAEEGESRGHTYAAEGAVGINFKALGDDTRWASGMSRADRLAWVVSHEMGHVDDLSRGYFSRDVAEMHPGGALFEEAKAAIPKHPFVEWVYDYPVNKVVKARELYAQNVAFFRHNKELMRELTPQNYEHTRKKLEEGRARPGNDGSDPGRAQENAGAGRGAAGDTGSAKARLLEAASKNDPALLKELSTSTDAKGLQRAIGALADTHPDSEAMKAATARLGALVKDPDTAYGLETTKYSLGSAEKADPNATHTQAYRDSVKDHITKVLGNTVKVAWKNLTTMQHAGDYTHSLKLIRLSVHALDPMSTGYHESLHAFFGQLRDAGAHDITGVLEKAASSQHVIEQLRERYKNQPEVLKQLVDPEERAAYMYQTWASDPTFKINIGAKTVFGKIKAFIERLMGAWTNDQRALHIMEYFHSGEYAQNMSSPSGVRAALMERNRSQILETAKSFAEPLGHLADAIVGTGGARLRDTGIPALQQLADIMKREHTEKGGDQGFIQASRVEGAKMRTRLGVLLEPYTKEHLDDAMRALHSNTPAVSAEGRLAVRDIKGFLKDAHDYMTSAGVNIGNLGPDYFPRVWDTHYISKNQQAFRDMLEPYIRRGEMVGTADDLIHSLTSREGVELGIESREPGMQFKKERKLDFITPQDAAQFVEKNLLGTLSSYINQAARKAEWTRRLGGGKLETLIGEAKQQGATKEHLQLAETYMKGIDGTLGDDLNPTARRIMGDMIVYQNVRLLPTAAFSMLIDPNGVLVRGGTVGEAWSTFKRGMAGIKDTFKKDGGESSADQATKWAELVGVVDSAMMSHAMGDVFSQGMVGGTAQKINNAFFKYNLVDGLNRNFRIGATEAAIKFLARHAGGLEGLGSSVHSERWMKELGLQKGDIKLVGTHIALTELEGLQRAQVQRVHAAINQWVDGAILRPDASDKPIWMNDPHYALISHLKQFIFSFQKTILERVVHEFKNGNYTPMMALASYVPIMMAADMAKGLLVTGGDTPEWQKGWGPADYLGYGVERAGLLGVGQFGMDVFKDLHRGGTGVGALAGPTIEQFGDIVSTLGGHKQFGNTVIDALPANTFVKGWSGRGESKADPVFAE